MSASATSEMKVYDIRAGGSSGADSIANGASWAVSASAGLPDSETPSSVIVVDNCGAVPSLSGVVPFAS